MRFPKSAFRCFLWTAAAAVVSKQVAAEEENATSQQQECGLYLAVSSTTTAEDPKWGLYAGKAISKGNSIGYGDAAIHTFHLLANVMSEDDPVDAAPGYLETVIDFFEQYIWVPNSSGGQFELADGGRIVTAVPGAGVVAAFDARMTNADWNHIDAYRRPTWNEVPGQNHPGRGAYTNYYNLALEATQDIPPGMEIFVNYGEVWEAENEDEDEDENAAKLVPEDYEKIDKTISKMITFFEKYEKDLDPTQKQEIYQFLIQDVMSAAAGTKKGAKITAMLPESPEELKEVMESGGSLQLLRPNTRRSSKWLKEHALCVDNLKLGPSTIPHAGRGAFATRPIAAGAMVAPVPLVQIPSEKIMWMHEVKSMLDEEREEYFVRANDEPINYQLLYNYCLGHPESQMLFLPAGPDVAFINHSKEPNAKLVWSDHPNNHKHWFELSPAELIQKGNQHLGLLMEVQAIKDIAEGEEVFIDYGPEWAKAWEEHEKLVQDSMAKGDLPSEWPIRALDVMDEYKDKPLEVDSVYPDNVMMKCFLMVKKPEGDEPPTNEQGESIRDWVDSPKTLRSENLFSCSLASRQDGPVGTGAAEKEVTGDNDNEWLYTVKWESSSGKVTLVRNIPHKAIVFLDKPGTSDQHNAFAFRHFIGIPDDIFPQGPWRNLDHDDDQIVVDATDEVEASSDDDDEEDEDEDEEISDDDEEDEEEEEAEE